MYNNHLQPWEELENLFLDIEWSDAIFPAFIYLAHIPAHERTCTRAATSWCPFGPMRRRYQLGPNIGYFPSRNGG